MTYRGPRHDFPSQEQVPGYWWSDLWDGDFGEPGFLRSILPPSPWDERALAHIAQHITTEADASAAYDAFAEVEDPQIKYLAALIATDEHRHHQMLSDIARPLEARVNATPDSSPPTRSVTLAPERVAALVEETRKLLAIEEGDVGELKKLRRELHEAPEDTMWPTLIDVMELDTEKHIRILKAIERHLSRHRWPR